MKNPGRVEDTTGDHGSSVPLMSAQGDDFDDQVLILLKSTYMKERLQRVEYYNKRRRKTNGSVLVYYFDVSPAATIFAKS